MEEMRCHSVRSSSRFFSLFGGSFSRHWERPPPTYDESLKHMNPDHQQRPPDPPPYQESFRARFPLSRSLLGLRTSSTPPPLYTSCEDVTVRQVVVVEEEGGAVAEGEEDGEQEEQEEQKKEAEEISSDPESQSASHSRHNSGHSRGRNSRKSDEVGEGGQPAPLVVRTSQSGIIPDTQNMIGLSELIPDNKEIDPTFQVSSRRRWREIFTILFY